MLTTIKNETISVTADTYGGELQAIDSINGISYLWNGDPTYWNRRAPILFPFVGSLRNNRATSAQGDISLPRHGYVRKAEWELESAEEQSMTFLLKSNAETLKNYPYPFELRVQYSIGEHTVTTTFYVRNTGTATMPFSIGGHTGFRVPLVEGEEYEDYIVEFEKEETADLPQNDLSNALIADDKRNRFITNKKAFHLNHVLFRNDALIFDKLQSRRVRLFSEKSRHGVSMDFADMDYFAVWSPFADSPFVCLEPWTGMCTLNSEDDVFEHKVGIRQLQPDEEATISFTVKVI
jgi:galactose mutarotase-like enzyme